MAFKDRIGALPADGTGPLYLRFATLLRDAIARDVLMDQEALPSERELCADYGISRITVRRAIAALSDEGLLVPRRGAGTFVAKTAAATAAAAPGRVEKSFSGLSSFTQDMLARGSRPSSRWLGRSQGQVTPEEALSLALSPGTPVYRFHRLRLADERPLAVEYSTVPAYCLPSLEAVADSLYVALDAAGARPARALQRLRAAPFAEEQATLLDVAPGHAGLLIERRSFLADGRAAELTLSYYRGDAYDFVAELVEV
ncbi:GntR family transcriptional regulator [Sphingomonas adhaesiva]|uniref:GntR family transcriptional regulator n=1 Tax=Sphingomonas adhaesiva TaxID=28212 RepID=UPI002FFB9411